MHGFDNFDRLWNPDDWTEAWASILFVEGEPLPSGHVAPGSLTLPNAPLALTDGFGGKVVGRVDSVWRDGNRIMGRGVRAPGDVTFSVAFQIDSVSVGTGDDDHRISSAAMVGLAAIPRLRVSP